MSLATITWPHVSVAATTLDLVLNHQDTVATMNGNGIARFSATFTLPSPTKATLQAELYPPLVGTSQVIDVASGVGPGTVALATSNTIQLACTKNGFAAVTMVLKSGQKSAGKGACNELPLVLPLSCQQTRCDGVYPVQYIATEGTAKSATWVLVVISNDKVLHPLDVVPLITMDGGATNSSSQLLSLLRTIASYPATPVTLATNYQALQKITIAPSTVSHALRLAVDSLAHRVIATPSPRIDFGQLSANGLDSQVQQQLNLTNEFLYAATGRNLDAPIYLRTTTPVASLTALAKAGVQQAVVAESSLVTPPSGFWNWGAPFTLSQTPGITAIPTFAPINQLLYRAGLGPATRANALLALLSVLHYEAPTLPFERSVIVPINARSADGHFLDEFLSGLSRNRVLAPSPLSTVLASSRIGSTGAPTSQSVNDQPTPAWTQNSLAYLDQLIAEVGSFNQSITYPWLSLTLMERLANAEQIGTPAVLDNALTQVGNSLAHQFRLLSVDPSSITLTSRHASIPVTLLSKAHYPITVQVQLSANGLSFPRGSTQLVTINSQTKSIRIPAINLHGSSLTLRINVLTKDGQFVLTHEAVQVRFAGASLAGYLLTFFSALVLALWWIRTAWRRRSQRKLP